MYTAEGNVGKITHKNRNNELLGEQDRGRFSVFVKKVMFSQEKSIKSLKYDANNTQDTEPYQT